MCVCVGVLVCADVLWCSGHIRNGTPSLSRFSVDVSRRPPSSPLTGTLDRRLSTTVDPRRASMDLNTGGLVHLGIISAFLSDVR